MFPCRRVCFSFFLCFILLAAADMIMALEDEEDDDYHQRPFYHKDATKPPSVKLSFAPTTIPSTQPSSSLPTAATLEPTTLNFSPVPSASLTKYPSISPSFETETISHNPQSSPTHAPSSQPSVTPSRTLSTAPSLSSIGDEPSTEPSSFNEISEDACQLSPNGTYGVVGVSNDIATQLDIQFVYQLNYVINSDPNDIVDAVSQKITSSTLHAQICTPKDYPRTFDSKRKRLLEEGNEVNDAIVGISSNVMNSRLDEPCTAADGGSCQILIGGFTLFVTNSSPNFTNSLGVEVQNSIASNMNSGMFNSAHSNILKMQYLNAGNSLSKPSKARDIEPSTKWVISGVISALLMAFLVKKQIRGDSDSNEDVYVSGDEDNFQDVQWTLDNESQDFLLTPKVSNMKTNKDENMASPIEEQSTTVCQEIRSIEMDASPTTHYRGLKKLVTQTSWIHFSTKSEFKKVSNADDKRPSSTEEQFRDVPFNPFPFKPLFHAAEAFLLNLFDKQISNSKRSVFRTRECEEDTI